MELLGSYSRLGGGLGLRGTSAAVAGHGLSSAVVALSAAAVGYASAKSNLKGKAGKIGPVPIPLATAIILYGAAAAGLGGGVNHAIIDAAKGALAAQATMFGIKQAYAGTNQAPVVAAMPRGQMPMMGATPATEAMLRTAGLQQQPG